MTYEPPFLLMRICPRCRIHTKTEPPAWSANTLSTPGLHVRLAHSGVSSASAVLPEGTVRVYLAGELHDTCGVDAADWFLRAYLSCPTDATRRLDGSFAIVVVDEREDLVQVYTDLINSRKIFHREEGSVTWLATSHGFPHLPTHGACPDEVALAQYMVNGIPLNHRTLFRGTRILEPASVHRFSTAGLETHGYWEHRFRSNGQPPDDLEAGLWSTLVEGVESRVATEDHVYVSLSGGFDAPAIACVLKEIGRDDVTCFTYASPDEGAGGDLEVARRLAQRLGFRHVAIPAYQGRLDQVVEDNVELGMGLTRLTIESDAWRALGERREAHGPGCILTGEEFYGGPDGDLRSVDHVFSLLGITGWDGVGRLSPVLPRAQVRSWEKCVQEELRQLIRSSPDWTDLHDLKDLFFLDQRLSRRLSWRETFPGRYAPVRLPLLSRKTLDFTQELPTPDRRDKRLFRRVLEERFPSHFTSPRANPASGVSVRRWVSQAVRRDRRSIEEMIRDGSSPFDHHLAPDLLLGLLERASSPLAAQELRYRTRRRIRRLMHRVRGRDGRFQARPSIPEALLLTRALFLRRFFQRSERRVTGFDGVGRPSSPVEIHTSRG